MTQTSGLHPQYYLRKPSVSCTVFLCYDAGESRRGAVLPVAGLRPFGGRDQPSPSFAEGFGRARLRHCRQDRVPTFGCGRAALGNPRSKGSQYYAEDLGLALCLRASVVKNKPSNKSVLPMPASATPAVARLDSRVAVRLHASGLGLSRGQGE
jgi:hypothetical protein